jgi:hypothetical protein
MVPLTLVFRLLATAPKNWYLGWKGSNFLGVKNWQFFLLGSYNAEVKK